MPAPHPHRGRAGNAAASTNAVRITHRQRIVDESTGITKIELVEYYQQVAGLMLEHLKGRPVSLVRAPAGLAGEIFFQKHMGTPPIPGVRSLPQQLDKEHPPLMEIATARGLAGAAQMGAIEFHTWNARRDRIGRPDRMVFDLDPGEGVAWSAVPQAALAVRAFLGELGLACFAKTSGGKGLHVVVPLQRRYGWDTVKDFSHAIVQRMADDAPRRFSAHSGPDKRVGRIYIDYLRNGFGATTVAAWSVRARPGMGVSVPLSWDEVEKLESPTQWHLRNIGERLRCGNAPWKQYGASAQALAQAMKKLGFAAAGCKP
ncbi:non-homologous end-joining DNA ligase [Candidimonas humi]|uniref:Non-homologous end-joining DNA ligase n=1 Tax=Candidimonas humi TaxID=683355 RepID=A0ABV8NZ34_9BURK|nr:non-homologous end-joining DNA ligase [Candidimonas humi]MBV6304242.1 non-homologous end-joining DNA ligase [Candidimonas humi]